MIPRDCGCPGSVRILDEDKHALFHELVQAQGLPPGPVNAAATTAARGIGGDVGLIGKRR